MDRGDEEPKETRSIGYGILFWILIAGLAVFTVHPLHRAIVRPPVTERQSPVVTAASPHSTSRERASDKGPSDTDPSTATTDPVANPPKQVGAGQMAANLSQP